MNFLDREMHQHVDCEHHVLGDSNLHREGSRVLCPVRRRRSSKLVEVFFVDWIVVAPKLNVKLN
jgi:hypothetical protein